jgi:hypothetical protein
MNILTLTAVVLTAAAATATAPAFAADGRLTDGQFVRAAHCRGLASGDDAATLDALLKVQKRGRSDHIIDRAYNARTDAERLARGDASAAQATLSSDCGQFMG